MWTHAAVFMSGALYECVCVFWVHYSERNEAAKTSLFSMLAAFFTVFGIEESVKDNLAALMFILGYGAGTFVAVKAKDRLRRSA